LSGGELGQPSTIHSGTAQKDLKQVRSEKKYSLIDTFKIKYKKFQNSLQLRALKIAKAKASFINKPQNTSTF
jgi:hypothetical protein